MDEIIKMEGIVKEYKNENGCVVALKDVSLSVTKGSLCAIIGRSGSGKSTLMNLLGLLDKPSRGSYYLDGRNVENHSEKKLSELRSRKIGYVFQSFHLIPRLNAEENVRIPLLFQGVSPENQRIRAARAIAAVGLSERIHHLPSQLSGGQQQRIAIARATISDPEILLADEPTGNLDPDSGKIVLSLLKKFQTNGTTVILITHDMEIAAVADKIYCLSGGEIFQVK